MACLVPRGKELGACGVRKSRICTLRWEQKNAALRIMQRRRNCACIKTTDKLLMMMCVCLSVGYSAGL
jgi:hypothetical protein